MSQHIQHLFLTFCCCFFLWLSLTPIAGAHQTFTRYRIAVDTPLLLDTNVILHYKVESTKLNDSHGELEYERVAYDLDINFLLDDVYGRQYRYRLYNWQSSDIEDGKIPAAVGTLETLGETTTLLESFPQPADQQGFVSGDSSEHPHPILLEISLNLFHFPDFADTTIAIDSKRTENTNDVDEKSFTDTYVTIQRRADTIGETASALDSMDLRNYIGVYERHTSEKRQRDNTREIYTTRFIKQSNTTETLHWSHNFNMLLEYNKQVRGDQTFAIEGQLNRLSGSEEQETTSIKLQSVRPVSTP